MSKKKFVKGNEAMAEAARIVVPDGNISGCVPVARDHDVIPVADPNMTSDVLRMARAQALMQLGPRPGIKQNEVTRRILEALKEEDMEQLFDPNAPPQPNPKLMEVQGKLQIEQQKLKIAAQEAMTDLELAKAQVKEIMAKTMLALAKAQTEQSKPQLAELELYAKEMEMRLGSHTSLMKEIIKGAIGAEQQQQT